MAHFARLNENDLVTAVIVVNNDWLNDGTGIENEALGISALQAWSGGHPHWAQTSYNNRIRVRYAGIGFTFNRALDAFIPPQPYPSWVLDEATTSWVAPVPMPSEGRWRWDEDTLSWVEILPPAPPDPEPEPDPLPEPTLPPPPALGPPERVSLQHWLVDLHTFSQRVAWNRAQELAGQLAIGSGALENESDEYLAALEVVGEFFMTAQLTQEVVLANNAIYNAGLITGVYASSADVDRIKSDTPP